MMCTSKVRNGRKRIAGFNLDLLGMQHRIHANIEHGFIEIYDAQNGWLPLFGVNSRGDFVGMPTCHPYDKRSDQTRESQISVLMADIDLLCQKRTFADVKTLAARGEIYAFPGVTWQMQISDRAGNVLTVCKVASEAELSLGKAFCFIGKCSERSLKKHVE